MVDRAPTHPIGVMVGDRGWAIFEAVMLAALAGGILVASVRLLDSGSIVVPFEVLMARSGIRQELAVIVATGLVGAAVLSIEGHRPRLRSGGADRLLAGVAVVAVGSIVGVRVAGDTIAALRLSSSVVFESFWSPPVWAAAVVAAIGGVLVCGRSAAEELFVRSVIQRRLGRVIGSPATIALAVLVHLGFLTVLTRLAGAPLSGALIGGLIESAIAGVVYDRTDALGPAIGVRLVGSAAAVVAPIAAGVAMAAL